MKVKEAERTANVAWSPAAVPRVMLAAGTAAQQLDATFSSAARLEVLDLALGDPSLAMPVVASVETAARFHCVSWGGHGLASTRPAGVIVGGADGGAITMYDAQRLLDGQPAVVESSTRHTGCVSALDFNPFQANLLASGASDSELFIWDLNSPTTPMTPGAKAQPAEGVSAVSWNKQVQHIMASTFSTRCVVWDLRKNEPIIKLSDGQTGMKCKVLAWHPDVATQLVLASDDDLTPTIQLWDLRFATSAIKTLQRHRKGILSLAWCERDSHLLLSAGKDDKILCWDPHAETAGGEVVAELCASPQWNFSAQWCPRNPALIAGCSFDGHISVYNVMGKVEEPPTSPTSTLVDSFPDMAGVAAALPAVQRRTSVPLTRPPGWMKRPCGATFGFGGRLVSFHQDKPTDGGRPQRLVELRQVVTEPELVQRSQHFQQVLLSDGLPDFCWERAESAGESDRPVWRLLAARLHEQPRAELLRLLGYQSQAQADADTAPDEAMQETAADGAPQNGGGDDFDFIARSQGGASESPTAEPEELFDIPTGDDADGLVSQAILRGDMKEAVERCVQADRTADALVIAMATSQQLFEQTRAVYLESMKTDLSRLISALVSHDWSTVVSRCDPGSWREALVAVLTHAPPQQTSALCEELGARLELQHTEAMWTNALLCYVCAGSVDRLVECWERTRPAATSPAALQDLMEQVMTLYRANQLAGTATPLTSGSMQRKLLRYAELLTSQGSMETALGYLGDCVDPAAVSLCERVQHSLAPAPQQAAPVQRQTAPAARFPATSHGYQVAPSHRPAAPVYQPPVAPVAPTPQAPAAAVPPAAAAALPAAAADGAAGGTSGYRVGGRRLYATDPTVAGGYGGQGFGGASSMGQYMLPNQPTVSAFTPAQQPSVSTFAPQPAVSTFTPQPAVSTFTPQPAVSTFTPQPAVSTFTPQPAVSTFTPQPAVSTFTPQPAVSAFTPQPPAAADYGAPVPPSLPQQPAVNSGHGWNDPPPLKASSRKAAAAAAAAAASPLTAVTQPIYNPADMMPAAGQQYGMAGQPYGAAGPAVPPPSSALVVAGRSSDSSLGRQMAGQPYGAAGPAGPPPPSGQFSPYQPAAAAAQFQPQQPPAAPTPPPPQRPEPPAPKGPVPAEHEALQTGLDRLRDACLAAAPTPQIKRRLDDVTRKLEVLYDLLRSGRVSDTTAAGLHQLVQYAQYGDLTSAQQVVQNVVASSNFAEVSGFMPGVKSLVQIAGQLQVQM